MSFNLKILKMSALCLWVKSIPHLSSEWQTTTLRQVFSPTEKVQRSGSSSTWLWIRYRSLLGRGGNTSTLGMQKTNKQQQKLMYNAYFLHSITSNCILTSSEPSVSGKSPARPWHCAWTDTHAWAGNRLIPSSRRDIGSAAAPASAAAKLTVTLAEKVIKKEKCICINVI